jgi:hypothetical protein
MVFITEVESVYCAVRTGSLNIIHANLSPQMLLISDENKMDLSEIR